MRRVLAPREFAAWLKKFLPALSTPDKLGLVPAVVSDPTDPKLVHLDGLNLSRAWMLRGMAAGLPAKDRRRAALLAAADAHAPAGSRARHLGQLRGRALAGVVRGVPDDAGFEVAAGRVAGFIRRRANS